MAKSLFGFSSCSLSFSAARDDNEWGEDANGCRSEMRSRHSFPPLIRCYFWGRSLVDPLLGFDTARRLAYSTGVASLVTKVMCG